MNIEYANWYVFSVRIERRKKIAVQNGKKNIKRLQLYLTQLNFIYIYRYILDNFLNKKQLKIKNLSTDISKFLAETLAGIYDIQQRKYNLIKKKKFILKKHKRAQLNQKVRIMNVHYYTIVMPFWLLNIIGENKKLNTQLKIQIYFMASYTQHFKEGKIRSVLRNTAILMESRSKI